MLFIVSLVQTKTKKTIFMKHVFTLLVAAFLISTTSQAQVAVGIGTAGVNVKSNPDKTLGLIFRQDFGLTYPNFNSELNARVNLTNKSDIKFYFGVGGGINYGGDAGSYTYVRMPIGLEYFASDRFSVTVESGFSYFLTSQVFGIGTGLFEISYYFGR